MLCTGMLHRVALIVALTVLGSCTPEKPFCSKENEGELENYHNLLDMIENPQYTAAVPIAGVWSLGFENSSMAVCDYRSASCKFVRSVDGRITFCWVELSESAQGDIRKLHGNRSLEDGSYYVEGEALIATQPGMFGHLNSYTCQIELQNVRVLNEARHPLDPPPPAAR